MSEEIINKLWELMDCGDLDKIEKKKAIEKKINQIIKNFLDNLMSFFQ